MKIVVKNVLIAMGAVVVGLSTSAAMAAVAAPNGWYAEANLGQSRSHVSNDASIASHSQNGFGWNILAGYKFIPYVGVEMGYTNYADSNVTFVDSSTGHLSFYSYDIAAKGILPLQDSGFDLFAKLGVAHSHVSASNSSTYSFSKSHGSATNAFYGVGVDYNLTSNVAANIQWQRARGNSNTGSLDLASAGMTFTFGN